MSEYTEAVARNLKGCDAASTGLCGACDQCRAMFDHYQPRELDSGAWECAGSRPYKWDTEEEADVSGSAAFADAVQSGRVEESASFSWSECGICGSRLGGDRYVWHWLDSRKQLQHADDACADCVLFLAKGDEPVNA